MTNQEFIESIKLEGEEWKDVVGYERRYAVSTFGRIASYSSPYLCGNRKCYRKPQLLKPRETNSSTTYLSVVLSDGEKHRKAFLVHRLVAEAFIPNHDSLPFINHKDENPKNNRIDNLEWCTQKYNCNYGTHNARMAKTISDIAYQRKKVVMLTLDGVLVNTFASIKLAAKSVGVYSSAISSCCRGINPTCRKHKWMYLSDYESLVGMSKNE